MITSTSPTASRVLVGGLVLFTLAVNSLSAPLPPRDSNELYVILNTLHFAAARSMEPTPYVAYGTLYFYILLVIYAAMYLAGRFLGMYHDPADFAVAFLIIDPSPFYLAGRLLSSLFAAGTVYVTYRIGATFLRSPALGLLAGLLLSLNKVHFLRAHAVVPDTAVAFFSALFLYYVLAILHAPTSKHYVLAGATAGLIAGTKANGLLTLVAFPIVHILSSRTHPSLRIFDARLVYTAVAATATLFLIHPYLFLKFHDVTRFLFSEADKALTVSDSSGDPLYLWIPLRLARDNAPLAAAYLFGFLYSLAAILKRSTVHGVLVLVTLTYVLVIGRHSIQHLHFLLPVFPVLSLMAASALVGCFRAWHHAALRAAIASAVLAIIGYSSAQAWEITSSWMLPTPQDLVTRWIEQRIPTDTLIALDSYERGPQIFTLERFFSDERLQDYRGSLPGEVQRRLAAHAEARGAYRTLRVKYYHPRPSWPPAFSPDQIRRFARDPFMEREYRLHWRTIDELRLAGVAYLVTTWAPTPAEMRKYPPDHILFAAHQRKISFYAGLRPEKGVVALAQFGPITIYAISLDSR